MVKCTSQIIGDVQTGLNMNLTYIANTNKLCQTVKDTNKSCPCCESQHFVGCQLMELPVCSLYQIQTDIEMFDLPW